MGCATWLCDQAPTSDREGRVECEPRDGLQSVTLCSLQKQGHFDHLPEVVKHTEHLLRVAATDSSSSSNTQFLEDLFGSKGRTKDLIYMSELCSSVRPFHGYTGHSQLRVDTCSRVTRSKSSSLAVSIRQASAKLSCFHGLPRMRASGDYDGLDSSKLRSRARAITYNMRNYQTANHWGPFKSNLANDVDWEKLEAILYQVVLGVLTSACSEQSEVKVMMNLWCTPFAGVTPNGFTSPPPPINSEVPSPNAGVDPYGIEGTWDRVVCFLDYGDFYHFNFYNQYTPRPEPRDPLDVEEAVILIRMKLQVTEIEAHNVCDKSNLPVVHFRGTSSLLPPYGDPNTGSGIRGWY